jgi:hypothetical protein
MERALEELVWRRAGARCEYCKLPQEHHELSFEIDHIIALKHGGLTEARNSPATAKPDWPSGPANGFAGLDLRRHGAVCLLMLENPDFFCFSTES